MKQIRQNTHSTKLPDDILSGLSIKVTPMRRRILAFAIENQGPFSAEEAVDSLLFTGVHFTTVYRNLTLFKEMGILREVDMRRGSVFYEFAIGKHHHHVVCSECGRVEAFDICGVDNLIGEFLRRSKEFKTISDHSFEMFGLCRKCVRRAP